MELTVRQVEALLALEEHGSFTLAGRALGLTQSAMSRAVAALERRIGGPLVHRGPDGAALTALGRQAAEHARAALGHLRAIEALGGRADAPRLRVGAVASALVRLVPGALVRLTREWPASDVLTVRGDDDELAAWLAADTIDLAVTTRPRDARDATATEVELTDQFLAVLPRHHLLARGDRVGLAEFARAGVADPGGTCGPLLAAGFAAHGVAWRPDHVVRDVATVLAMAAAGITAGVVPALAAPRPAPAGVTLLPLDPPLRRTLYVRHRTGDRHAATFADLLAAET
ncbi:LysR family transcriptional regulator [Amycolatopsis anabasis]|uniref:LysR family transcriptional regulator n=1 Tax=Amycolatopsis anabasis TaxID=1840409 RepID=UPI00131D6F00|nr:LysR family transcriptional regulator [Amycolatopsis anabasis]